MMKKFQILNGLPGYGPMPEQFSSTGLGTFSEGYVIKFLPDSENQWIGNFQPGLSNFHKTIEHPNGEDVIVISGGEAYVVSPLTKKLKCTFGGQIEFCESLNELDCLIFGNGLWFEIVHKEGTQWSTERISWDGMRKISIESVTLSGEAWDPTSNDWKSFKVNLLDGTHEGGSYIM